MKSMSITALITRAAAAAAPIGYYHVREVGTS